MQPGAGVPPGVDPGVDPGVEPEVGEAYWARAVLPLTRTTIRNRKKSILFMLTTYDDNFFRYKDRVTRQFLPEDNEVGFAGKRRLKV